MSSSGGLSPRLRGNLDIYHKPVPGRGTIPAPAGKPFGQAVVLDGRGTIPAPAGKPHREDSRAVNERDYPRACGETLHAFCKADLKAGLSPRLRGNL